MTSRRGFILGLGAALAAPAIVKAESLMKIAALRESLNEATLLLRVLSQLAPPQPLLSTTFPAWQLLLYDMERGFLTVNLDPEEFYVR